MTKLRDLEVHLRDQGCALVREGGRHSIWLNPVTKARTSVPRHREIPRTTARAICRQLGVPDVE
ncbi:MAG TPA: type II toxin-antitoxin system HicA family toxin [Mycobacteriales bacterium]|jgi:predicted RNA binding protein YcfA (HicA-like mRNA interferase family)|nr:type II toxin-antitoxin system HicA family toxin [Mycobacteriales bacterium]